MHVVPDEGNYLWERLKFILKQNKVEAKRQAELIQMTGGQIFLAGET